MLLILKIDILKKHNKFKYYYLRANYKVNKISYRKHQNYLLKILTKISFFAHQPLQMTYSIYFLLPLGYLTSRKAFNANLEFFCVSRLSFYTNT